MDDPEQRSDSGPYPEFLQGLKQALPDRYEIERLLGEGGMAIVYLALDRKHDRKVALKVLRPELAAVIGAERFLAEIRTTANLQNPHILPLFDSGEANGFLFYTMPYVEGESLRDRLRREHQLPVDEAVSIATALAHALGAAHKREIIHRDIKPENILMSGSEPLLTDFGIALAVGAASGQRLTETGLSLGTPQYMSPEQVTGEQYIGPASDVYALASVLYEMLAGDPPYAASTPQAVIGRMMSEDLVLLSKRRPTVPPNVEAAVRCALEKVPADRFATTDAFARALANPAYRYGEQLEAGRGRRGLPIGLGLGLVLGLGLAWVTGWTGRGTTAALRLAAVSKVTFATGLEINPALSPDGREVAYMSVTAPRQILGVPSPDSLLPKVMVKAVEGGSPVALSTESVGAELHPSWSPDGASLLFQADGRIYTVASRGGIPRALAPAPGEEAAQWGTWSPDGQEFAYRKSVAGGDVIVARAPDGSERMIAEAAGAYGLRWSPNGRWIAFVTGNLLWDVPNPNFGNVAPSQILVVSAGGGDAIGVTAGDQQDTSPAWLPDGRLLFVSSREGGRDIFMVEIGDDGQPTGEPVRVTAGLAPHSISVSRDGSRLAYSTLDIRQNVRSMTIPADGVRSAYDATSVTVGQQIIEGIAISPDGEWIAFDSNRSGNQDIYRRRLVGGEIIRLTTDPQDQFVRSWSPDGEWLAGHAFNGGDREIALVSRDGFTLRYPAPREGNDRYPDFSPDGSRIVFYRDDGLFMMERNDEDATWRESVGLAVTGASPRWSPDGSRIAFRSTDPYQILIVEPGSEPQVVYDERDRAAAQIRSVVWHDGGNRLLFLRSESGSVSALWSIRTDGTGLREVIRFDDPGRQPRSEMAVHGETVYFTIGEFESDIWVVDLESR